ncbi:MAG: DUF2339 domain-containing protein [bacterium]
MLEFTVFVLAVVAIVRAFKLRKISQQYSELKKDVESLHARVGKLASALGETSPVSQKVPQAIPMGAEEGRELREESVLSKPVEIREDPLAGMDVFAPTAKESLPELPPVSDAELEAQALGGAPASEPVSPPQGIPVEPPISPPRESAPPPPPPPPKPPKPRIEWERWIGVRGAALLGGIVLAIAAFLFFQYSVEQGFIRFTPVVRVVMGTVGGLLCLVFSEWFRKKKYAQVPNALSGAGVVLLYTSFWAAHTLYQLIGTTPTFVLMILTTVVCALLSIRYQSLFVAVLGLVGGFLTPLLLSSGKDNPIGLFTYVLLLDVGFLWVAQKQRWSFISYLAMIGTFLLEAAWIFAKMGPDRMFLGIGVLILFALFFAFSGLRATKKGQKGGAGQQALAVLVPFLFSLYFAGDARLGEHLYPISALLLVLCGLAFWVDRKQGYAFLLTSAASATMTTIVVWLCSHTLSFSKAWEVLGSLAVFSLLFSFAHFRVAEEKRAALSWGQVISLSVSFVLCFFLAGARVWDGHFYPIFALLLLLNVLTFGPLRPLWGRLILSLTTASSLFVTAVVWFSFQGSELAFSARLWESVGLMAALAVMMEFWVEKEPENLQLTGPLPAAFASSFGFPLVQVVAFHFLSSLFLTPWLAGWALYAAIHARRGSLPRRGIVHLFSALLFGIILASAWDRVVHLPAEVAWPLHLYLLVPVAWALAYQFLALLRRGKPDGVLLEHSAALFSVLLLSSFLNPDLAPGLSFYALLVVPVFFGCLALLVSTRLGQGVWALVAILVTAFVHADWTWSYPHLQFEKGWILGGFILQGATVLLFTFWPFAFAKRFKEDRWIWMAGAITGPLWFYPLKKLFVDLYGDRFIGILPVALGFISLTAASRVKAMGSIDDPKRKNQLVWFLAVALGFVSVAIPLQLKNEWITIGWAIEGFLLVLLWKRLDHAGLKYFAVALLFTVTARLIFNSEVLLYHERSAWRIVNWLMYTYWVPAVSLIGSALVLSPLEKDRARPWERPLYLKPWPIFSILTGISAIAVIFVWINLAIADWFSTNSFLSLQFERHPARDLTTSIAWGVYAIILLGVGMARRSQGLRWVSLIFLVLTIGKVFLYDLGELKDLYRVMSLVGLAFSLLIVSLAYQRFVFRKTEPEAK